MTHFLPEVDALFARNAPANPHQPGVSCCLKRKKKKEKREKRKIYNFSGHPLRGRLGARTDAPYRTPRSPLLASRASPVGGKGSFWPRNGLQRLGILRASVLRHLDAKNAYASHEREKSPERVSVRGFFGNGLFRGREATPSSGSQFWGLPPPAPRLLPGGRLGRA